MSYLEVRDLTKIYGKKETEVIAVDHVTFQKEENHEDGGMLWPTPLEEYTSEEKGFEKYRQEVIKELRKRGFPILSYIKRDQIMEMSVIAEEHQNNDIATEWSWNIGVIRDVKTPDEEIKLFCEKNSYVYGTVFDENELDDYLDMMKTLKTIRVIAWIISACITIICFVQILNTLYANMTLREKELWLYSVVGMSPGQKTRMLLLEHTFAAFLGIVSGYLAAWGISWYFVEYLLNQDGAIIYVWSWNRVLPIEIIVFMSIMGISILEMKSKKNYN